MAIGKAISNIDIAAFDVAEFSQAFHKGSGELRSSDSAQNSKERTFRRNLGARQLRQNYLRHGRATNECDELTPLHGASEANTDIVANKSYDNQAAWGVRQD
jgi:hypothetical protein